MLKALATDVLDDIPLALEDPVIRVIAPEITEQRFHVELTKEAQELVSKYWLAFRREMWYVAGQHKSVFLDVIVFNEDKQIYVQMKAQSYAQASAWVTGAVGFCIRQIYLRVTPKEVISCEEK